MTTYANKCPVCKSTHKEAIRAVGGEWVGLIYATHGSARLYACADCGVVYIDEAERMRIKETINKSKRKKEG